MLSPLSFVISRAATRPIVTRAKDFGLRSDGQSDEICCARKEFLVPG